MKKEVNIDASLADAFELYLEFSQLSYMDEDLVALEAENVEKNVQWGADDEPIYSNDYQPISPVRKLEGSWNLTLPVTIDSENTKQYTVNQETGGFGIAYVIVTPYEVKVQTIIPPLYQTPAEELEAKKEVAKDKAFCLHWQRRYRMR